MTANTIKQINGFLPNFINNISRRFLSFSRWDPWQFTSWSQEGEDLLLARIFGYKKTGFYVDVGAHHPKRFSNTYYFYRRGWRGINIDAMPGSMRGFHSARPKDINLEVGIGKRQEPMEYHIFNEPALNSFASALSNSRDQSDDSYKIIGKKILDVHPLSKVLDQHLPPNQSIDFMSVDVEGFDLDVLQSNNWCTYRPRYVLAEILDVHLHEIDDSSISKFMKNVNYQIFAKCFHTAIFKNTDHPLN